MPQIRKTKGVADPVDKHVGHRLRIRRSLMGMSQEKLASSIGLTFQQIQKYEKGTNRISAGRLYHFSKILQVPILYFFEQFEGKEPSPSLALGLSDNKQEAFDSGFSVENLLERKETIDLLRTYYSISDEGMRKDILNFVKSMSLRAAESGKN